MSSIRKNNDIVRAQIKDQPQYGLDPIIDPTPHAEAIGGETLVSTPSISNPFNARITNFADGRYVVSWTEGTEVTGNGFSTFFRIYAADGTPTTPPIEFGNPASADNDYASFAVLANGNIAAVWGQGNRDIVTRVYTPAGAVAAAEFVVATPSTFFPDPAILALASGYVLAYSMGNDVVFSMRTNTGAVVGTNRFLTDVSTATFEDNVDLARLPSGGFVAVWVQETYPGAPVGVPTSSQVFMRLFDATGAALGGAVAVNAGTAGFSHPSVATLGDGGFIIAWQDEGAAGGADIVARRYDASGAPAGAAFTVNAAAGAQVQPSTLALAGGGFLIAWQGNDGDGNGIFAQVYDAAGVADGGAFRVNETVAGNQRFDGTGAEAVVQLADGTIVFTWSGNGEGDAEGIYTRRFSPEDLATVAPDASDDSVSTLPGQPVTINVLANDFERDNAATVTAVGAASTGSVVINPNGTITYTPGAGFNGSDSFTYTITGPGGTDTATVTILDGRTPQALGPDILANQSASQVQDDASITALEGGGFVASWGVTVGSNFHAMARVFAADGTPLGNEFQISTGSYSISAVTALANGGFAILWAETPTSPDTLFVRTYDATGAPVGAVVTVGTSTNFAGSIHLTAREAGGFVAIWSNGADILARFHDDNGAATGAALTVSGSPRTDRFPAIEQLEGGGYVATWQRTNVNGNAEVWAVRLDAAGAIVGAEFRVPASGITTSPVVAALDGGGFVILWTRDGDIFARRYDAAGTGGTEFRVNSTTAGTQNLPAVYALDGGGFVAAWVSDAGTGNDSEIVAQVFDAAGLRVGSEFQVNAAAAGRQSLSNMTIDSIAQQADGTLVFMWEGAGIGDSGGIFVRRFALNDTPPPITGTPGPDTLTGTPGNDLVDGGDGDDLLLLQQGGNDDARGGNGDDGFYFGGAFGGGDSVDGGSGTDQIGLQGNYAALTLGANSTVNVEMIVLLAGNDNRFGGATGTDLSYNITTVDANVAAGQMLIFQANTLRAGENFTLNGAAETNGSFLTYGGRGTDTITGGQRDDGFYFGTGRFNAGDRVDGQGGSDQLGLQGDYAGANALTLGANQLAGIEFIVLLSASDARFDGALAVQNFSYTLTTHDNNVAAGQSMVISATALRAAEILTFDGSAELDGSFRIFSGAGADTIIGSQLADEVWGGAGADRIEGRGGGDVLRGGAGSDLFIYRALSDSTAAARDRIMDFAAGDLIDLSALDANSIAGGMQQFQLISSGAAFTAAGQLRITQTGAIALVEGDSNGDGIADFAIEVTLTGGHTLTRTDFLGLAPAAERLKLDDAPVLPLLRESLHELHALPTLDLLI